MQKGDKTEVRLALDTDAAQVLAQLAGSPRKQGEYVSKLIRAAAAGQLPNLDLLDRIDTLQRHFQQELDRLRADVQSGN